jgi:hypothetical protein
MSDTVENHYWEHPYHLKNDERINDHPNLKIIWHCDEDGNKKYGFDKILWPYRYLCIVDYAANSKGAVDSQKVVQIEHFKS